ncbi:helix-turn-helix domain-containing protein [Pedobacter flavus]|uniref:Helix-turn-helix transcriptional regulator n=1 Tax=Pedobacter flavus TaxID=3113906 RepID=A0ABU7H207_9SPHI|nr:helix-turn-helix transcriptional regulator [Pedobacter sp. VNH31]MEE1885068.1 helix-turn-helix transcriptional regulator [Pedobacter sp. VNH31]
MGEQNFEDNFLKLLRANLWAISNSKKITLEDIQDRTGLSYSQVYRIMRGNNNMSIKNLIAVCKALEVQPMEVMNIPIEIPKHHLLRKNRKAIKK